MHAYPHRARQPRATRSFPLTTLAAALLAAGAVQAQPAPQPAKPAADVPTETVVITGFRASIEGALTKRREESSIVDAITAEDIGKFPDTNLAESLQRVAGVVIDRDAGEGRNIHRARPGALCTVLNCTMRSS